MSKWKLYWVASNGLEDCFVVAKNSRSAARIEKEMNGFENDELSVTRIMDIPDKYEEIANKKFRQWSKKNHLNSHLDYKCLKAWPYYAEEWLLKELGAEYRTIEGKKEILIDDVVITSSSIYTVGLKAIQEISNLFDKKSIDISNVSYEGLREVIDSMLGVCLTTIHRIEDLISNSFIFAVGNKKYDNFTINDLKKHWRDEFTFGRLIHMIEERYEIDEIVHSALKLFLIQRNKIAHGLTKDERFDIDTLWGQKEIVGYLALFLRNAWILEEVFESAYIVSMGVGFTLIEDSERTPEIHKIQNDFENDPHILEKVQLFSESFKMRK